MKLFHKSVKTTISRTQGTGVTEYKSNMEKSYDDLMLKGEVLMAHSVYMQENCAISKKPQR